MKQLYYNLAKKSILATISAVFLFSSSGVTAKVPNDPYYADQQPMWQQIGAERAWDFTTGSKKVTVAIIDTGADIWHDDLRPNVWKNPYEIEGNNYDDDGNGYIDDIHGWNFIENNNDVRTNVQDNLGDPEAINHGTIIAGLVGASSNNKAGVGLNWQVQVMSLRALASDGSGSYTEVAKAVEYATENGADVIGLSVVGDNDSEALRQILKRSYDEGVVIVAAAGNSRMFNGGNLNDKPQYPICMDSGYSENFILGVSAVDSVDRLSSFAEYGSCVDLVAPGQKIYSLERYAPVFGYNDEFGGPWQGTSFAVPLVAGAAALLKAQRPDWEAPQIIEALLDSADNVQITNNNFANGLGSGRLNIGRAIENAAGLPTSTINLNSQNKYYFEKNIIYTKEDDSKIMFAGTGDAKIIALKSVRSYNIKKDEVYALVKRGKYYYVQFFTENGIKWKEKVLPTKDYTTKRLPTSIGVNVEKKQININFAEKITKKVKKGKKFITQTSIKNTSKSYNWLD